MLFLIVSLRRLAYQFLVSQSDNLFCDIIKTIIYIKLGEYNA